MFNPKRFLKSAQEAAANFLSRSAGIAASTAHSMQSAMVEREQKEPKQSASEIMGDLSKTTIDNAECIQILEHHAFSMRAAGVESENQRLSALMSVYQNLLALREIKTLYEDTFKGSACHLVQDDQQSLTLYTEGKPLVAVKFDPQSYSATYKLTRIDGSTHKISPRESTETVADFATRLAMEANSSLRNLSSGKKFAINDDKIRQALEAPSLETLSFSMKALATEKYLSAKEQEYAEQELQKIEEIRPVRAILALSNSELQMMLKKVSSINDEAREAFVVRAFEGLAKTSKEAISGTLTSTPTKENFLKNYNLIRELANDPANGFKPRELQAIQAFESKHGELLKEVEAHIENQKHILLGIDRFKLANERDKEAAQSLLQQRAPQPFEPDAPRLAAPNNAAADYQWQLVSEKMTERVQEIAQSSLSEEEFETFQKAGTSLREQVVCLQGIMQNHQDTELAAEVKNMSDLVHEHEREQNDRRAQMLPATQQAFSVEHVQQMLERGGTAPEAAAAITAVLNHLVEQNRQLLERIQKMEATKGASADPIDHASLKESMEGWWKEPKAESPEPELADAETEEPSADAEDAKEVAEALHTGENGIAPTAVEAEGTPEEESETVDLDAVNAELAEASNEDSERRDDGPSERRDDGPGVW